VGGDGCEPKPGQEDYPDLAAEATAQQDMIQSFRCLKTHDAIVTVLQAMPHPAICCPATTMHSQPEEEPDLLLLSIKSCYQE